MTIDPLGLAGVGFTFIFGVILIVFPKIDRRFGIVGLGIGVLIIVVAVGITFLPDGKAQAPPVVNQGPGSAYSYGQQDGVTAGTIMLGQMPRRLSDAQFSGLSAAMAASGARGKIEVLTDVLDCQDCDGLAKQFEAVLSAAPGLQVIPRRNGITAFGFKGIALGVKDPHDPPASAKSIIDAFNSMPPNHLSLIQLPPDHDTEAILVITQP